MDKDQQITAIKSGLAALDSAIAQTQGALQAASNPDDIRGLTSTLVDLRSERFRLQAQLDNLEAATAESQPLAATAASSVSAMYASSQRDLTALQEHLTSAVTDRSVVAATLTYASAVHKSAKQLRTLVGEQLAADKDDATEAALEAGFANKTAGASE